MGKGLETQSLDSRCPTVNHSTGLVSADYQAYLSPHILRTMLTSKEMENRSLEILSYEKHWDLFLPQVRATWENAMAVKDVTWQSKEVYFTGKIKTSDRVRHSNSKDVELLVHFAL